MIFFKNFITISHYYTVKMFSLILDVSLFLIELKEMYDYPNLFILSETIQFINEVVLN